MIDCPVCNGYCEKCEYCKQRGIIDIPVCPLEYVTRDVWEAIEYAELYQKGLPPVAGGALDQAYVFIKACRFIWNEQNYCKKKLGILDG